MSRRWSPSSVWAAFSPPKPPPTMRTLWRGLGGGGATSCPAPRGMQLDGSRDALQLDGPDVVEPHPIAARGIDDRLADEDLARPGVLGDARGHVDRLAVVVALLDHDGAGVEPDVGRRQARVHDAIDHLERRDDPGLRVTEVEHHPVAEPLHGPAAVLGGAALHDP